MTRTSGISMQSLIGSLAAKPEALLLLAAGAALMMRGGATGQYQTRGAKTSQSRRRQGQYDDTGSDNRQNIAGDVSGGVSQVAAMARETGAKAREYVADTASSIVESAGSYASTVNESVSDYAGRARRGVTESSDQFAETVQRLVREQPLSVMLAGLAAGAAVAAAFPVTDAEDRMLAPAKQRLADVAGRASEQLKSAGVKATERFGEVIEDRGLSADGLKEAARDVAGAFTGALGQSNQADAPADDGKSGSAPVSFGP